MLIDAHYFFLLPYDTHLHLCSTLMPNDLLFWTPRHGARRVARPTTTYIVQLGYDTELHPNDLLALMQDRDFWRQRLTNNRHNSSERKTLGVLVNNTVRKHWNKSLGEEQI